MFIPDSRVIPNLTWNDTWNDTSLKKSVDGFKPLNFHTSYLEKESEKYDQHENW